MRTRRSVLMGTGLLALTSVLPASAALIQHTGPALAFTPAYPQSAQQKVLGVLQRKDCTFVDGYGAGSFTLLRYRGTTLALNRFLDELAACPGVTVSVSLKKLPEEIDWRLSHEADGNRFRAEVNLNSPRLDPEKLVIPELKGPRLAP
jgi:hypothetical protein